MKTSKGRPRIINETAYFQTVGYTAGWTGQGKIQPDSLDNVNRWYAEFVQRDFGKAVNGLVDVSVLVRLRALSGTEILEATAHGQTQTIAGVLHTRIALYQFIIRSSLNGEVSVRLQFQSGQTMVIERIAVYAPTPERKKVIVPGARDR